MVFEGLLASVINRFLGAYVKNLDASQLNVGIWGGKCCTINACIILYIKTIAEGKYMYMYLAESN